MHRWRKLDYRKLWMRHAPAERLILLKIHNDTNTTIKVRFKWRDKNAMWIYKGDAIEWDYVHGLPK